MRHVLGSPVAVALVALGALGFGVAIDLAPAHTFVEIDSEVSRALTDELARSMKELKLGDSPRPYYVSYALSDVEQATVVASFGAVTSAFGYRGRVLRTDVRVGSPAFDNSNTSESMFGGSVDSLPVDDDYPALRRELWLRTDEAYKVAVETLAKKKAAAAGQANHADDGDVADFSKDAAAKVVVPYKGGNPETDSLLRTVDALSTVLREYPQISVGRATGFHAVVRRRFLSSEGGSTDESKSTVRIDVVAETQAPDGMRLVNFVPFVAPTPIDFPPIADMERAVRRMAMELVAMTKAPTATSGTASVLFEGLAAGQIAKLLIADNLSGTPAPRTAFGNDERGQTSDFADRLGQKVASPLLTVVDDPSLESLPGSMPGSVRGPIWGAYRVDDEGMLAARVSLIEGGILKGLLMTRTPRKEILHSNGHARATRFGLPHATLGTLFVTGRGAGTNGGGVARLDDSHAAMSRPAILAEMNRASKAGGLSSYVVRLLDDSTVPGVSSPDDGFSMISMGGGRTAPSVKPLVVYRLRADGKEELVRGLTLEGLVPRSLRDIVAMGRDYTLYNFAEGGSGFVGIPQTIVTPALCFADVDVRRSVGKNHRPPLYPRPDL
jgi:TldD protein